jgi:hypothetical protein
MVDVMKTSILLASKCSADKQTIDPSGGQCTSVVGGGGGGKRKSGEEGRREEKRKSGEWQSK